MTWKIFTITYLLLIKVSAKYENIIDVDDILSPDFMPGSLLMLENPERTVKNFENGTNDFIFKESGINGTFDYALDTMEYHRSMMNEYLCRNFIAEQIIEDMSITRLKRRLGGPEPRISSPQKVSLRENLIEDEGSSNYKNWLQKSTTLEDIYKHYQQMEKHDEEYDKDLDPDHESYDTHALNYGYPPAPPIGPAKLGHTAGGGIIYPSGAAYGYGGGPPTISYAYTGQGHSAPTGHSGYGYSGPSVSQHGYDDVSHIHIHHDSPPLYQGSSEEKGGKDLGELFEIALTALAYLSFGMFVVHVVVCISQAKKQEVYYMPIVTMTSTSTTTAGTVGMPVGMGMSLNGDDEGIGQPNMANGDGEMMGDGGEMMNGEGGMMNGDDMMGGDDDMMGANGDDMMGSNGDDMMGGDGDYMMGDDNGGDGENRESWEGGTGEGYISKFKRRSNKIYRTVAPTMAPAMMMTGRKRRKRKAPTNKQDIPTISNPDTVALNELAKHILTSIEAALVAHQDDGSCLRKMLCENNKYSRSLENSNKIWIPVWSLGMSWLSGKLTKGIPPATSMLDSLKASILGLGKANCKVLYQECDLQRERQRRRRRRKK